MMQKIDAYVGDIKARNFFSGLKLIDNSQNHDTAVVQYLYWLVIVSGE